MCENRRDFLPCPQQQLLPALRASFRLSPMEQARLIIDEPRAGSTNMAIDEAILTAVGQGQAAPTLRSYRWSTATISLGHFQKHAQIAELPQAFSSLPIVRRITGGGAILHDAELTYSLILPVGHQLVANRAPAAGYGAVHGALIAVLASHGLSAQLRSGAPPASSQRGPFFCFERINPSDVTINGKKIAGSAQRRTLNSFLQHGSLMLGNPLGQPGLATMADFQLVNPPTAEDLALEWAKQLGATLQLELVPDKLNDIEMALLDSLREKYASDCWTNRR